LCGRASSPRSITMPTTVSWLAFTARDSIHTDLSPYADAVGSVAFHPLQPLLLSVSGSRHFGTADERPGDEESDSESGSVSSKEEPMISKSRKRLQPSVADSSVRLWGFPAA
jgi:hypothetical protein